MTQSSKINFKRSTIFGELDQIKKSFLTVHSGNYVAYEAIKIDYLQLPLTYRGTYIIEQRIIVER